MTAGSAVDGDFAFVLAIRDHRHGLSFWSKEGGFDTPSAATVFSKAEATTFDLGVADDQPEWLGMPASLGPGDRP